MYIYLYIINIYTLYINSKKNTLESLNRILIFYAISYLIL